jgi:hypothetical protein
MIMLLGGDQPVKSRREMPTWRELASSVGIRSIGNSLHFEHRFGVTLASNLAEVTLSCQEGASLHKEDGEGCLRRIIDLVPSIPTAARVC